MAIPPLSLLHINWYPHVTCCRRAKMLMKMILHAFAFHMKNLSIHFELSLQQFPKSCNSDNELDYNSRHLVENVCFIDS